MIPTCFKIKYVYEIYFIFDIQNNEFSSCHITFDRSNDVAKKTLHYFRAGLLNHEPFGLEHDTIFESDSVISIVQLIYTF